MTTPLLEVKNLKKYFPIHKGFLRRHVGDVKAVENVSFILKAGETLGLVGESGCGKSTTGRTLLRLVEATAGEVKYNGIDVLNAKANDLRKLRREMQIIFQDPYSSLNPRITIGEAVGEALREHNLYKGAALKERIQEVIEICGLADYHVNRYPHEFSGGQRQRIGIARALALDPSFIVADEPVSALDVSIQAQIINLMMDLQEQLGLSYLFISHDLSVVKHISDRVGVMYLGDIVELANKNDLYDTPLHPYTKALLSAIPVPDPKMKRNIIILKGDIPSPSNPPSGCKFHTRCPIAQDICKEEAPEFKEYAKQHFAACHLIDK
ncbi:ABC transporter ATP-binding protein [Alkaliphilus peptidifermentans]|uniref:Peptide/nickel transport system ATP-binding protein n=1 Tax=Alkaliphilus peptidifermentans DSM 18978 TaxID=1120976 RepID=A0A1G5BIF9_9FIRM|nr:dipeptide ABC transporter ATP-binding protein [Alkaliphilus peptidifermentans]SCX89935.1 peptide/nickel transport system ATP-binding protein [Alkaliphilus peptidifermentans DSM 18978]